MEGRKRLQLLEEIEEFQLVVGRRPLLRSAKEPEGSRREERRGEERRGEESRRE